MNESHIEDLEAVLRKTDRIDSSLGDLRAQLTRRIGELKGDRPDSDDPPKQWITDVQVNWIRRAIEHGVADGAKVKAWVLDRYGVRDLKRLTDEQGLALTQAIQSGIFRDAPDGDGDGVPGELDNSWDPPALGFEDKHYQEPGEPDLTVAATQARTTDCSGKTLLVTPDSGKRWMDLFGDLHAGAVFKGAEGATFCKLRADANGWGQLDSVHFWDLRFENEPASTFTVGAADQAPGDLSPTEDYSNSDRATKHLGLLGFHRCHFGPEPGATSWQGFGGKMWLHVQAPHDMLVEDCTFDPVREHHIYGEWVQRLHVRRCSFPDTGGNAIQVASRGGHTREANYLHGNRLNTPSGLDGWALIEDCEFNEKDHKFRDASDISFFGFLGPIVVRRCVFNNTISALAFGGNPGSPHKGDWIANGEDLAWNTPELHRTEVEGTQYPGNRFAIPDVWLDQIVIRHDPTGKRSYGLFSGVKNLHVGEFECDGPRWFLEVPSQYGGPWPMGSVRFYHPDSVERHLGRIGYYDAARGRVVAYTEEQLQDLTVTPSMQVPG